MISWNTKLFILAFLIILATLLYLSFNQDLGKDAGSLVISRFVNITTKVGMYTPYHIVPGGGERYFLTSALAFQTMGYEVDILVESQNACDSIDKLKNTAKSLRIDLDFNRLKLHQIEKYGDKLRKLPENVKYEVFYSLGNSKFPSVKGYGTKVNYYMCQFPFDYADEIPKTGKALDDIMSTFSSYGMVLTNSFFTSQWYEKATKGLIKRLKSKSSSIPSVNILYPPVQPFPLDEKMSKIRENSTIYHISLLGRFFVGRQNKGHSAAIDIFTHVLRQSPKRVVLNLIGAVSPGEEHHKYVDELKKNVTVLKLPVNFLTNASPKQISKTLSRSLIQWHLTGIHEPKQGGDPASLEHFGISVLEGMSLGCIPIVLNKGGTAEIVRYGVDGFVVDFPLKFTKKTLNIIKSANFTKKGFQVNAMKRAKVFHQDSFIAKQISLTKMELSLANYRRMTESKIHKLRNLPKKEFAINSTLVAVMIEPFIESHFDISLRSVMRFLNGNWSLQIHHSVANKNVIHIGLSHFSNIQYVNLPESVYSLASINTLMKTRSFWLSLNAEHALIFNSNTVMLRPGISEFLAFDYVGANWNKDYNETLFEEESLASNVGKGGFSLRNIAAMIDIIDLYSTADPDLPEDIFCTKYLSQSGYNVAPPEVAYNFSREVIIDDFQSQLNEDELPLGLHALWLHTETELVTRLIEKSMNFFKYYYDH